jgi:hypothetical protein
LSLHFRCGRCICSGCSLVLRSPVPLRLCIQCLQGTTATQKIDLMTGNDNYSTNKLDIHGNGNGNENSQRVPEFPSARFSSTESEHHPPKVIGSSPQLGVRTLPIIKPFERRHTEYPPHSRRKDEGKEKFRHSHQPRSGTKKTRPLSSSDPRVESALEVIGMAAPRWEPNHPTFSHSVTHDTDTADGVFGEQSDISPSVEMNEHGSTEERHNILLDIIESRTFDQDLYQQYQQREGSPTLQHPSIAGRIETSVDASSYFSSMMMYQVDPNPTSSYQVVASQAESVGSNPAQHHHQHQEHRYACDLAGISIEKAQMEIQGKEKEVPKSSVSNYIEDYNDLTEMLQQSTSPPETATPPFTVPQQPISIDPRQRRAIKISDKIMDEDDFHWSTEWVETAKEGGSTNARARALYHEFAQAAQATVKVIVSELNLPEERKTYRPIDVGGVAGGVKVRN